MARAAETIDAALFTTPAFTIDEGNERVAGHRTIAAARQAVATGRAATWVATVRPGVVAVDVDLDDDDEAAAVLAPLMTWCDEHSVWSVARRSGGGAGRWHLLAVPADLSARMLDVVEETRRAHEYSRRQVDVRRELRPLTAPHRVTGQVDVPDEVERAARDLAAAWRQPGGEPAERRRSGGRVVPRPPLSRPLAQLDGQFWRDIGRAHAVGIDRSEAEFEFTKKLVYAGYSEPDAWAVVENPAHAGFARSRRRGRTWWRRYYWNRVEATDPAPLVRRSGVARTLWEGPFDWSADVVPAALALRKVWGVLPTRRRHTMDHILAVVACRFTRKGERVLPLSLRSVAEDSGHSVTTVHFALGWLVEAGILELVSGSLDKKGIRAYEYALNVDVLPAVVTDTPSSYTPPPSDPLWIGAPAATLSHWLSLHLESATYQPSRHQGTTSARWLRERRLTDSEGLPQERTEDSPRVRRPREGMRRWTALRRRYRAEKQSYRAQLAEWRRRARERWEEGRRRARERAAARSEHRQRLWWLELSDDERRRRSVEWREWWNGLTLAERERRRAVLDARRDLAERGRRTPTGRATALVA